jgi:hypothetical protein
MVPYRRSLAPLLLLLGAALLASAAPPAEAAASSCSAGGGGGTRRVSAKPIKRSTPKNKNKPHPRHRSLLQQGPSSKTASANGAGYSALGEAPIAISHIHLLPGTRDQALVINYFDASGSYPPGDGVDVDGRTIARVFDRSDFSFGVVPVTTNAVCGAWAR